MHGGRERECVCVGGMWHLFSFEKSEGFEWSGCPLTGLPLQGFT